MSEILCPVDGHTCFRITCGENPSDPDCTQAARDLTATDVVFASLNERLTSSPQKKGHKEFSDITAQAYQLTAEKLGVDPRRLSRYADGLLDGGFIYLINVSEE